MRAGVPGLPVQITDVKLSSDKPQPGEYLTVDVSGLVFENIMVSTGPRMPSFVNELLPNRIYSCLKPTGGRLRPRHAHDGRVRVHQPPVPLVQQRVSASPFLSMDASADFAFTKLRLCCKPLLTHTWPP